MHLEITNKNLQKKMDYIVTMEETIDKRRLDWLAIIARQSDEKLPKKLCITWIMNPRKAGGQKQMLHNFKSSAIKQMLVYNRVGTNPFKECSSKTWIPLAKDIGKWKLLIFKC